MMLADSVSNQWLRLAPDYDRHNVRSAHSLGLTVQRAMFRIDLGHSRARCS
jgi:hypothetical protein